MAIGLAWTYLYCFVLWDSALRKSGVAIGGQEFLILVGVFIGMVFGNKIKERIVLFIVSTVCSLGMMWVVLLILFIDATGRFLDHYKNYPW